MTVWTFGKIALAVSYRKKQMLNSVTWILMIHERNKRGPKGHHIMFSTVKGQRSLHHSAMQCYRLCHIISSSSFSCCSFEESDPTVSVIRKQINEFVKTLGGYWAPLLSGPCLISGTAPLPGVICCSSSEGGAAACGCSSAEWWPCTVALSATEGPFVSH